MKDGTGNGGLAPEFGTNPTDNPTIGSVIQARYSRRQALFGGGAVATVAALGPVFALSACDDGGGSGQSFSNPVASAGEAVATSSGKLVTLNGSGTDADGTVGTGRWVQTSGPAVAFLGAVNSNTVSFLAPSVPASTPLGFRFTVTDDDGLDDSADTTVTVAPAKLDFSPVAKNLSDIVTVPPGYTATVLYALGDPIRAGTPAYANNGTDTGFASRAGDHHDALYYFGLGATGNVREEGSSSRGLLVMNHENITQPFLHANGPTGQGLGLSRPEVEVVKEMEAHGVSVVEVTRSAQNAWSYVQNGALNRRVTLMTEMSINGPVRGDVQVRTQFSPDGARGRGTINNCANGYSAWGSYLTCEENWAFYFRRDRGDNAARSPKQVASFNRYGIREGNFGNYAWTTVQPSDPHTTVFRRWNATANTAAPADGTGDFRNEPHQFGWVVEIDPYDPNSTPRKRTALGRFAHEGCWPAPFTAGRRPVYYMGDDNRGDYIYKFVSAQPWDPTDANRADRLAVGDKYLDQGVLYVARFNADGTGDWLPLIFGQGPLTATNAAYPFANQADVLISTRLAGDALGATKMDRPEWGAVNPLNNEVYMTLTNSNAANRPVTGTNPANPRSYADPRTRADGTVTNQTGNPNGHIIRFREAGGNNEAIRFNWDIFLFGADDSLDARNVNISGLTADNEFASPDGLWFARPSNPSGRVKPVLWIQTDDGSLTDQTNNQMLAAMPGVVGDGAQRTITNTQGAASAQQTTFVGQPASAVDLRRFVVGPRECEITGVDSTPDGRALFINIQHPGEDTEAGDFQQNKYNSNWPATQADPNAVARPRSATVVITKNDGGVVGL